MGHHNVVWDSSVQELYSVPLKKNGNIQVTPGPLGPGSILSVTQAAVNFQTNKKTLKIFYQTSIENTNQKKMNNLHGGLISHSRLSFSSDLSKQFSFPSHTLFRSMHSPLSHVNSVRASQHLASLLSSDLSEQSTWPSQRYSRGMHCSSLWQVNWFSLHS